MRYLPSSSGGRTLTNARYSSKSYAIFNDPAMKNGQLTRAGRANMNPTNKGLMAAPIVRATHHGRHGHPVIFARAVFDELRHADPAAGAKSVLRAHEAAIVNVEVEDPGVVTDVDTPEDYARLFGGAV